MCEHLNVFVCECVHLMIQGGQVSCESSISSCPPPSCTHPTNSHGQCCPTCHSKEDKHKHLFPPLLL